jgi:hypothetical protein
MCQEGQPTFHANGVINKTSSKANMACWYIPSDKYKSDNSAQASASVGEESRNLLSAVMASVIFFIDLSKAMRRFDTGYQQVSSRIDAFLK